MTPTSPRARSVTPLDGFRVMVTFSDGTLAEVDLTPFLSGPVFDPIREDRQTFAQVRVAEVGGCLEWPNGADIDPELLYEHATKGSHSVTR
jgi:hypothetical protein